jgi:hypothetical protein
VIVLYKVEEPKKMFSFRLKPSLRAKIKDEAKKHNMKAVELVVNGIEMYIDYLNQKEKV